MDWSPLMYVFSPIILLEFVVGVPATIVLLLLVFKSRSALTNTNVYLASLSFSSFLQLMTAVLLFVMLICQKWLLGNVMCSLTAGTIAGGPLVSLLCHLLIVRDKYKAVKNPSEWRWMKSKKAYVSTVFIWIAGLLCALVVVSVHVEQGNVIHSNNTTSFDCFVYDRYALNVKEMTARIVILIIRAVIEYALIISTFVYHVLLNRSLSDTSIILFDSRTARSLFLIFMVQAIASQVEIMYDVLDLLLQASYLYKTTEMTVHVLEVLIVLVVLYIPTLNPAILIVSSRRYRQRVIHLLKGRFSAEIDENYGETMPSYRQMRSQPMASFPVLQTAETRNNALTVEDCEYSADDKNVADNSNIDAIYFANRSSVTSSPVTDYGKVNLPNMVPN